MISPLNLATTIATERRSPAGEPSRTLDLVGHRGLARRACAAVRSGTAGAGTRSCVVEDRGLLGRVRHAASSSISSVRSSGPDGGGDGRASPASGGQVALVLVVRRISSGTCSTTVSPKPSIPAGLHGLLVRIRDRRQAEVGEDLVPIPTRARRPESRARGSPRGCPARALAARTPSACSGGRSRVPPATCRAGRRAPRRRCSRSAVLELLAAVAAERVEHVAGEALGVDADEHVLGAVDVAADEGHVVLARQRLPEGDGA